MRRFKREIDTRGKYLEPVTEEGLALGKRIYDIDNNSQFNEINSWIDNAANENYVSSGRFAGEEMSQALTDDDVIDFLIELEGAAPATSELPLAYQMLMDKTNEYAQLNKNLVDAGVRPTDIGMYKELDTGTLKGNVPGPYIKSRKGNETRVFMDRQMNDITGKPELVPFADPSTGAPLTQKFGMLPIDGKTTLANEVIQQTALKLAGMDASFNNRKSPHYSDHIVARADGSKQRIEGKIRDSDRAMTDNIPIEGVRLPNTSLRGYDMTNEVGRRIRGNRNGRDLISKTEDLIERRELMPPGDMDKRLGKILRSDPTYMTDPNGIYDSMVVTGYPASTQRDPEYKTNKKAVAPENVLMVDDLSKAKKYIEGGQGRLLVTLNSGFDDNGPERAFVQAVLNTTAEQDGRRIYRDMTVDSPNVGQLLRNLEYIKKPER